MTEPRQSSTRRRATAPGAIAVLACLALAGCGGSRVDHATLAAAFAGSGGQSGTVGTDGTSGTPGTTGTDPGTNGATGTNGSTGTTGTNGTSGTSGTAGTPGTPGGKPKPGSPQALGGASVKCKGTEQPINLAAVGEQSGVAGATEAPGPKTVAAWAGWVNANGGLACHKVNMYIGDAGGDPSKNASLTQQYVEKNGVIAFIHQNGALSGSGGTDYLVRHNIPVIGGDGGDQNFYKYPLWFPQVPQGNIAILADTGAIAVALNADQRAHFGFVTCQEAAQCTNVAKVGPAYARQVGLKIVFSATASITQGDYTSVCLNAQKAGAKALILALDGNSMSRFAKSCKAVNYNPVYGTGESAVSASMQADPNLSGMVVASLARPWTDNSNPSIAQMNRVINQYAPGLTNVGQSHLGWASAMALTAASKFFPQKDTLTSADIAAAMTKIKNDDLGGITGALTFTAGRTAPTSPACFWTMELKGGQFVGTRGNRKACV